MRMHIAGVKLYGNPEDATFYDGPEVFDTPQNLRKYAFIKDQRDSTESISLNTADRTTTGQGATLQVYVKAGTDIENVAVIWVDANDLTQWEK
jgi:hypothetical protein